LLLTFELLGLFEYEGFVLLGGLLGRRELGSSILQLWLVSMCHSFWDNISRTYLFIQLLFLQCDIGQEVVNVGEVCCRLEPAILDLVLCQKP